MVYEVWVLYFKSERGAPRHWSIFIKSANSTNDIGSKHDAMSTQTGNLMMQRAGRGIRWRYTVLPNYNATQSSTFDSKVFLGYINDPRDLEAIMEGTPMPIPPHENCQNWVWAIIQEAVRVGLMDASALTALASIPTLGLGVS